MKKIYLTAYLLVVTITAFSQIIQRDSIKIDTTLIPQSLGILDLVPNITPQAPNTAALGRFGEYQVDLLHGLVPVQIPIYEIVVGNIRIPISLRCHLGGNKVTDVASAVGLAWALDIGGQISRNTVGKNDELYYLPNGLKNFSNYTSPTTLISDLNSQLNGTFDEGADIFNYSLLGTSGKFVLKPELSGVHQPPYILPDEKLKVDYIRIGGNPNYGEITSFFVTDTDGLQYTFD